MVNRLKTSALLIGKGNSKLSQNTRSYQKLQINLFIGYEFLSLLLKINHYKNLHLFFWSSGLIVISWTTQRS
ncbi:hypothetical protein NC651_017416 [Populus alba x Populus x berolinensis]|nr:hypothetical protein NC651_017416 [Populus alba x Populus x berolinensis]